MSGRKGSDFERSIDQAGGDPSTSGGLILTFERDACSFRSSRHTTGHRVDVRNRPVCCPQVFLSRDTVLTRTGRRQGGGRGGEQTPCGRIPRQREQRELKVKPPALWRDGRTSRRQAEGPERSAADRAAFHRPRF